jgi:isoquinoline 1-oxidoreductase beta subunit
MMFKARQAVCGEGAAGMRRRETRDVRCREMSKAGRPTRRFVMTRAAALGGAFALGFHLGTDEAEAQSSPASSGAEINAWVIIRTDNTVIIRVARSEMGQGSMTGLAQLLAEELDCDWSDVRTEYVSPGKNRARNRIWRDMSTTGSRSIRGSQEIMRQAGAAARVMLLEAAAELWQVSSGELTTAKGGVSHRPSRKTATYGKLASAAAKRAPPDFKTLKLKDEKDWVIAGQPLPRLDLADRLDGSAVYGIDIRLPGMLNAAIKDAPVLGAKIASIDQSAIVTWPGVQRVLQVSETAVAVVADTWWQAKTALDSLTVTWTEPQEPPSSTSIDTHVREGLESKDGFINHAHGDALKAIAAAAKRLDAVYSLPFLHQAPLEPLNCTARWTPEQVEVWAPTQNPDGALQAAADAAGLPVERADRSS